MTTYQQDERSSYPGYTQYPRPPTSSHGGDVPSPDRLHSAHHYVKGGNLPPQSPYQGQEQVPPGSSHGYPPQPPITPLSSSTYPPQPPPATTPYYGLSTPSTDHHHVPSPPPSSSGRPESGKFTADGAPIVPVGISGGKMFRCRGYGDCDKVFTRSEHLARHVRKHTGERPFPCHCGKAFSRLDNLRQHSATVHADQAALNDAMLTSLAHVHATLSQRANRDQRKRGEIVEVPKNAVERPRHNEQYRKNSQPPAQTPESPYTSYPPQEHQFTVPPPPSHIPPHARSRPTGLDHAYPEGLPPHDESGPSRRPGSGYSSYAPVYYDTSRPPTASSNPPPEVSHLPYPYRPMSSGGRDLPVPAHYQESEPPSSAHGMPPSPMYSATPHAPQWSSPPASHSHYPPQSQAYPPPPPEGYSYPPQAGSSHYPPPPPSSHGPYYPPPPTHAAAPPSSYYPAPPPGYGSAQASTASYPPPLQSYAGTPASHHSGEPPASPYPYHAPPGHGPPGEPYGYYDPRKRRVDDHSEDSARKAPRASLEQQHVPESQRNQEALWLPPTTERRSSLAISALLGSPQQVTRPRPLAAEVPPSQQGDYESAPQTGYTYTAHESSSSQASPSFDSADVKPRIGMKSDASNGRVGENMEQKAKALLSQGR